MLSGYSIYLRRTAVRETQGALGDAVGVSASVISNIENCNGRSNLTADLARRIELVLRRWENKLPDAPAAAYDLGRMADRLSRDQLAELLIFAEMMSEGYDYGTAG